MRCGFHPDCVSARSPDHVFDSLPRRLSHTLIDTIVGPVTPILSLAASADKGAVPRELFCLSLSTIKTAQRHVRCQANDVLLLSSDSETLVPSGFQRSGLLGMTSSNTQNHGWLATPSSPDGNSYDAERLQWEKTPRWARKRLRLRKTTVCLLVIDLLIVGILVHLFNPLITLLRRNEELFGARLTLPLDTPYAEDKPDQHTIPRIFHQTSATKDIPEKWLESVNGCKEVYKTFEYKVGLVENMRPRRAC